MRKTLLFAALFLFGSVGTVGAIAHAQEADTAAGKEQYNAVCLSCHGPNGASLIPANPILAGQQLDYLRDTIAGYRDGTRANAVMSSMVKTLTDEQINNIAQYLSEQQPVIVGAADMEAAKLAERLYRGGSIERGIAACAACHGPAGAGVPALAPRLSGQYAEYTIAALKAYANGDRENAQMNSTAAKLTEEEINNLAEFIAGLSY